MTHVGVRCDPPWVHAHWHIGVACPSLVHFRTTEASQLDEPPLDEPPLDELPADVHEQTR